MFWKKGNGNHTTWGFHGYLIGPEKRKKKQGIKNSFPERQYNTHVRIPCRLFRRRDARNADDEGEIGLKEFWLNLGCSALDAIPRCEEHFVAT